VRDAVHPIQIFEFTSGRPMSSVESATWSKRRFAWESRKEPLLRFPNGRLRLFAPKTGQRVTRAETERGGFTIDIDSFLDALERSPPGSKTSIENAGLLLPPPNASVSKTGSQLQSKHTWKRSL
jgi:hypothetical protein